MRLSTPALFDGGKPVSQRSSMVIGPAIQSGVLSSQNGSVSGAIRFYPTVTAKIVGVRFYWASAGSAKTIKVSLWDDSSSRLATTTVAVNASGVYEVNFTTPYALTAGTMYRLAFWENGGTKYTKATLSTFNTASPTRPAVCGGGAWVLYTVTAYGSGDVFPGSTATTEAYPIEPLLDV